MIAPLRTEKKTRTSRRLSAAHAMIAAMFLKSQETPPPIAAWKAWLFMAWVVLTAIAYALSMAGLPSSMELLRFQEPR